MFDPVRRLLIVRAIIGPGSDRAPDLPAGVSFVGRPIRPDLYLVMTTEDIPAEKAGEDFDPVDRADKLGKASGEGLKDLLPIRMGNDADLGEVLTKMGATDLVNIQEIRDHWRVKGK